MVDVTGLVERAGEQIARSFGLEDEEFARLVGRAALLAALDPEDKALVEVVARAIYVSEFCYDPPTAELVDDNWASCDVEARAAIAALKALAQGNDG